LCLADLDPVLLWSLPVHRLVLAALPRKLPLEAEGVDF
jgi:hypothetical protein